MGIVHAGSCALAVGNVMIAAAVLSISTIVMKAAIDLFFKLFTIFQSPYVMH